MNFACDRARRVVLRHGRRGGAAARSRSAAVAELVGESGLGDKPDNICSLCDLPVLTPIGDTAALALIGYTPILSIC
jgi:hypothetical protein